MSNIETGWKANFQGDWYHLFNETEDRHGNKSFDAVLDFFHYFNGFWHVDDVDNQSMMIEQSIRPLFMGTDYVLNIIDNFYANTMSYSKQQNSTQRFIYFINRHDAEFNIPIGTQTVQIRNRIGVRRNDIIIHEDDNLIDLSINTDTSSFCTAIEYYYDFQSVGDEESSTEKEPTESDVYISPMADKYGIHYGEPIHDERYTIKENAEEAARLKQEGTWQISFDISAELFDTPLNEGDEIRFVAPSKTINSYIRVVEINEEFDEDDELIGATYTFGNENISNSYRNAQYDSQFDIEDILRGKKVLDFNVLPNAVREATNVINNADSNMYYRPHEIYGVSKDNPLGIVRMNSEGLGFSQDGGENYETAMTHLGIVADAVTTGTMLANRIAGGILMSLNNNTVFNLNTGNLVMSNVNFDLGGGADIHFHDAGNRLYYQNNDWASGMGVGRSINDTYPFVMMGVSRGSRPHANDGSDFSGFIANANDRESVDNIGNSAVGHRFHVRDVAVAFSKGMLFNVNDESPYFSPMNMSLYDYRLGTPNNRWHEIYGTMATTSTHAAKAAFENVNSESAYNLLLDMDIKSFFYKDDDITNKYNRKVGPVIEQLETSLEKLYKSNQNALDDRSLSFILFKGLQTFINQTNSRLELLET